MNNMGSKNYLSLSRKIGYGQLAWLHNSHCNVGLYCILPLATLILILMENNFLWTKKTLPEEWTKLIYKFATLLTTKYKLW